MGKKRKGEKKGKARGVPSVFEEFHHSRNGEYGTLRRLIICTSQEGALRGEKSKRKKRVKSTGK